MHFPRKDWPSRQDCIAHADAIVVPRALSASHIHIELVGEPLRLIKTAFLCPHFLQKHNVSVLLLQDIQNRLLAISPGTKLVPKIPRKNACLHTPTVPPFTQD